MSLVREGERSTPVRGQVDAGMVLERPMKIESPNVTKKFSTMSPGKPVILGSKGQGHESQIHCRREFLHSCEC